MRTVAGVLLIALAVPAAAGGAGPADLLSWAAAVSVPAAALALAGDPVQVGPGNRSGVEVSR